MKIKKFDFNGFDFTNGHNANKEAQIYFLLFLELYYFGLIKYIHIPRRSFNADQNSKIGVHVFAPINQTQAATIAFYLIRIVTLIDYSH